MSRLLGIVGELYGEMNTRALAVYDDALVVLPGDAGIALHRALVAGGFGAGVGVLGADAGRHHIPEYALEDPSLLAAAAPGRQLIPTSDVVTATLGRSMFGLRRDLLLRLRSGKLVLLRWPPLGPMSRDKQVLPMLRAVFGDKLGGD